MVERQELPGSIGLRMFSRWMADKTQSARRRLRAMRPGHRSLPAGQGDPREAGRNVGVERAGRAIDKSYSFDFLNLQTARVG